MNPPSYALTPDQYNAGTVDQRYTHMARMLVQGYNVREVASMIGRSIGWVSGKSKAEDFQPYLEAAKAMRANGSLGPIARVSKAVDSDRAKDAQVHTGSNVVQFPGTTPAPPTSGPVDLDVVAESALQLIHTAIVVQKDVYAAQWLLERIRPDQFAKPSERVAMAKLKKVAAEAEALANPGKVKVKITGHVRTVDKSATPASGTHGTE